MFTSGPWDTDVRALGKSTTTDHLLFCNTYNPIGSKIRPHTDITEIDKNLTPLWFDGVDPAKIVMGIAYYGRTYQLSDPSCSEMNACGFVPKKGGAPGQCTNFEGVLSNREIQTMLAANPYVFSANPCLGSEV